MKKSGVKYSKKGKGKYDESFYSKVKDRIMISYNSNIFSLPMIQEETEGVEDNYVNKKIDAEIRRIDKSICRYIDRDDRAFVTQDVITDLRHFVEHIMLKIYANGQDIEDNYSNICAGITYVKSRAAYKKISRFHDFGEWLFHIVNLMKKIQLCFTLVVCIVYYSLWRVRSRVMFELLKT